ncbi:ferredoxin-type protein NapF [Paracoccus jiaweipingae]|uniref:ferredoxin-type protein NapF n=1 Tax=unclassified Paracoccus (in: a-proteobacteria) TaxID=2688777 RepID=UPI0037A869C9
MQACTGCGDCAAACGQDIIRRDGDGLAVIDAHAGECVFCGDCVTACTTGALVADGGWPWRAALGEGCLHQQGITCRACEDMCEPRAIRFRPQPGGRSLPQLSQADCTGCMACIGACPEGAITLLAAPRPVAPSPFQEANPC